MEEILFIKKFISSPDVLFQKLQLKINWDGRMQARKTASFGKAYNYSQITYPDQDFLPELTGIISLLYKTTGFEPNNCLCNYYPDGKSSMGFHSDQTDILEKNTGIAIISLGEERILRFKNILDRTNIIDYVLPSGSLICMSQELQHKWQHAIPKSDTSSPRISLTFRSII